MPTCEACGCSLVNFTCFSEGPESFPWAALHSRAISAYFSFSSSLRSLRRWKGKTRRSSEGLVPGAPQETPGHCREAVPASVCPGPRTGSFLPLQQGPGSLKASFPPAWPSHLPTAWPRAHGPPALPPSQGSSRGWRQRREPQVGLSAVVRGSSPARRNSKHCGWPGGSAWRA